MAEMNELLEQAATQALDLREEAESALSELEELVESAEKVGERVSEETEGVRNTIQWLIDRLNQAEGSIETTRGEAGEVLGRVESQAEAVREGAGQLSTDVTESLTALKSRQDGMQEALESQLGSTASNFADLATRISEASQEIAEGQQEAMQALSAFGQKAAAAQDEAKESGSETLRSLGSAAEEAARQADVWTKAMGGLLKTQTDSLLECGNRMLKAHNASMTRLKTRIGDDVEKAAAEPVDKLLEALQNLRDVADSHRQLLTSEVKASLDRVQKALPEIEELVRGFRDCARL